MAALRGIANFNVLRQIGTPFMHLQFLLRF
jgi:hypothetical protein